MVYVERGRLAKAHACLMHAHQLAPHEDYIVKHIQIVQTRLSKLKSQPDSSKEKELAFSKFDPRDYGGSPIATTIATTPAAKTKIVKQQELPSSNNINNQNKQQKVDSSSTADNQPVFIESTTLP